MPVAIVCAIIFLAKIADNALATIRIVFVSRGMRAVATGVSFFEVAVWIGALGLVMANLTSVWAYVAYAAGVTVGAYLGMVIEQWMAIGTFVVRIVTQRAGTRLTEALREDGFGVTTVDAEGLHASERRILYCVIHRADLQHLLRLVHEHAPNAFTTVENVQQAYQGWMPTSASILKRGRMALPSYDTPGMASPSVTLASIPPEMIQSPSARQSTEDLPPPDEPWDREGLPEDLSPLEAPATRDTDQHQATG